MKCNSNTEKKNGITRFKLLYLASSMPMVRLLSPAGVGRFLFIA